LEGVEFYIRSSMLALGACVLERLLHEVGVGRRREQLVCARGHLPQTMLSTGVRDKTVQTILGLVRFSRSRFVCPSCGAVRYPGDESLHVEGTGFSPGLRRLMTRAGSRESFAEGAEDLDVYGAIKVDPKDVERVSEATGRLIANWMKREGSTAVLKAGSGQVEKEEKIPLLYVALDGTGAPMRASELQGVVGKGEDGRARTREVKLGCVFTQTTLDEEGNPLRDEASTSYLGAIQSSADFGPLLHAEAVRRGLRRADRVIVLSDGAEYNHVIAEEYFPQATHIIDFFHAAERLNDFLKNYTSHPVRGTGHQHCFDLLEEGRIEEMLKKMREALPRSGPRRAKGLKATQYFAQRTDQMRYGEFRRQRLFIGSGVIEAGCRTVIGKRLKQSGMFWTVAGANAIVAARCCLYSGRFEQFWEDASA
jgi:hypothetical protein